MTQRLFDQFVAIDWSGQAVAKPKGISMALAQTGAQAPVLTNPAGGWSRQAALDWMLSHADRGSNMLIGMDLSPAFAFADCGAYFPGWGETPRDAKALWAMVDAVADGDSHLGINSFLAHKDLARHFRQVNRCGDLFPVGRGRLRVCEVRQSAVGFSPYSCFNLIGAAQVGKSSLTGMRLFHRLKGRIPLWPFDPVPPSGPVIVEIYTTIAARAGHVPKGRSKMRDGAALDRALNILGSAPHDLLSRYDDHATDAILTSAWLRQNASRDALWTPAGMTPDIAKTEGWTFGVA